MFRFAAQTMVAYSKNEEQDIIDIQQLIQREIGDIRGDCLSRWVGRPFKKDLQRVDYATLTALEVTIRDEILFPLIEGLARFPNEIIVSSQRMIHFDTRVEELPLD